MKQEMLINVAQAEECRIAIVEDGLLEELYLERTSQSNFVGNIYKGRIVNLEPSIQAAFVDFGVGRKALCFRCNDVMIRSNDNDDCRGARRPYRAEHVCQ